jgi:hypothetical protein
MALRAIRLVLIVVLGALGAAAPADAYVYWTTGENIAGPIGRANLDGGGVRKAFIARGGSEGIAIDGAHVYWTYQGGIDRANLNGTGIDRGFIRPGTPVDADAQALAVDGDHIYWADTTGVGRADRDGTDVDPSFIKLPSGASGVAVDDAHVYWSDSTGIGRANLAGTGVNEDLTPATGALGVAVDSSHVYWLVFKGIGVPGSIGRANLDGSSANPRFISDLISPSGLALDARHVYWAAAGLIGRAKLDGTRVNRRFIDDAVATGLAVDALGPTVPPKTGAGKASHSRQPRCSRAAARAVMVRYRLGNAGFMSDPVAQVLCGPFLGARSRAMVVSFAVPTCGGPIGWAVFRPRGRGWQIVMQRHEGGLLQPVGSNIKETQNLLRRTDPLCNPTGGTRSRVWHYNGARFVVTRWAYMRS